MYARHAPTPGGVTSLPRGRERGLRVSHIADKTHSQPRSMHTQGRAHGAMIFTMTGYKIKILYNDERALLARLSG